MGNDRIVAATVLPDQFRQRAVVADEVRELGGGFVDAQAGVERGEDFAGMDWLGFRPLAPVLARPDRAEVSVATVRNEP